MTVREMAEALSLTPISVQDADRVLDGVYIGDLLSWVMGRAESGCVWATIMTNLNVIAVASLADVAVTVVCEDSEISDEVMATAEAKEVNLVRTPVPMYEFCVSLSELLK